MSAYRTLDALDAKGRTVLLRVDLNVPMKDGKVTDATRIERAAPTILALRKKGAKVVVLSHFGRPKGERVAEMSLAPVAAPLAQALGDVSVAFADDCVGAPAETAVAAMSDGDVLLLENLRFHKGEEKNEAEFTKALAKLGDIYVNDAFATAHRAHASTEGLAHHLPAYAGLLMQAELEALGNALESPKRPVAAVVGGAKVSTKLDLLGNLLPKVDYLIIGGGMANTFLFAQGHEVGKSLAERDLADTARKIIAKAEQEGCTICLQTDCVVAAEFAANAPSEVVPVTAVPDDKMILDAGPESVAAFAEILKDSETLVWNGPLGAFEIAPFDAGTVALARTAAELTDQGALLSVAGGGDTVAALVHAGVADRFSYVSTAGGAFLEWLEGKTLPGVAALMTDR
ncbi:phosphoglycerate kinase [Nisaea acidiphila]|uniref:Phosphoglycerate kinase n=1 Tax=Nisaea acidiphila TaxID=1862145 RepID=A0A9J7AM31_9PROT|nr:phosphoglycerate kinase [Nisaea acidiphila]UUX48018.1 phosphoglycerate kinase [Nisaea acidiphila]